MTPNDLYKMESQSVDIGIGLLFGHYFNHIVELDDQLGSDYSYKYNTDHSIFTQIEVRVIKNFNFDGRRFWRLATVWFEGSPVMVIQNAGREGDDHRARFITDPEAYKRMLSYIKSLVPCEVPKIESVGADEEINSLVSFYDHSLGGHFEPYRY